MIYIIILIGIILIILGLIGCVIPALPGTPLNYSAILILAIYTGFAPPLTIKLNVILGILTIIATVADTILPVIGARRYGASKTGIWLSFLGLIIGLFFPPFGFIIGMIIGAFVGELINGKKALQALKASWGIVIGTIISIIVKFSTALIITYYFIKAAWQYI